MNKKRFFTTLHFMRELKNILPDWSKLNRFEKRVRISYFLKGLEWGENNG